MGIPQMSYRHRGAKTLVLVRKDIPTDRKMREGPDAVLLLSNGLGPVI